MSQENVEKVRASLATWDGEMLRPESRPFQRLDSMEVTVALYAPDFVYEDAVLPDHVGETYQGYEGVARATERWLEPFESLTVELERIVGTGDRLVSIHRVQMKARHTGIDLEGPLAYVWTFRDGKVIHLKSFSNPAEALEAAGLSE